MLVRSYSISDVSIHWLLIETKITISYKFTNTNNYVMTLSLGNNKVNVLKIVF